MTALDRLDAIREQAIEMTYHGGVTQEMASCAIASESALRKVLELHKRAHAVFSWRDGLNYEPPCETCDGKAGTHECGCWADSDMEYVCAECHRLGSLSKGVYDYTYPCPTVRLIEEALG